MDQHPQGSLRRSSTSFRLRSQSLNTLRLRRVFDLFDGNGDGEITAEELTQALNRLGLEADAADLGATVSAYVKPGLHGLEFDDFQRLHTSLGDAMFGGGGGEPGGPGGVEEPEEMVESDLTEAFKVFDEDGDGFISAWELQAVLGKLGLSEGREIGRVRDMICSVDRNADGRVDFDEFKYMMQSLVSIQGAC